MLNLKMISELFVSPEEKKLVSELGRLSVEIAEGFDSVHSKITDLMEALFDLLESFLASYADRVSYLEEDEIRSNPLVCKMSYLFYWLAGRFILTLKRVNPMEIVLGRQNFSIRMEQFINHCTERLAMKIHDARYEKVIFESFEFDDLWSKFELLRRAISAAVERGLSGKKFTPVPFDRKAVEQANVEVLGKRSLSKLRDLKKEYFKKVIDFGKMDSIGELADLLDHWDRQRLQRFLDHEDLAPDWFPFQSVISLDGKPRSEKNSSQDYRLIGTYFKNWLAQKSGVDLGEYLKKKPMDTQAYEDYLEILFEDEELLLKSPDQQRQLQVLAEALEDDYVLKMLIEQRLQVLALSPHHLGSLNLLCDLMWRLVKKEYPVLLERFEKNTTPQALHELFFDMTRETMAAVGFKQYASVLSKAAVIALKGRGDVGRPEQAAPDTRPAPLELRLASEKNMKTIHKGAYGEDCTDSESSLFQTFDPESVQINLYLDQISGDTGDIQGYVQLVRVRDQNGRTGLVVDVINPGNRFPYSPSQWIPALLAELKKRAQEEKFAFLIISSDPSKISNRESVQKFFEKISGRFQKQKYHIKVARDFFQEYQSLDEEEFWVLAESGPLE